MINLIRIDLQEKTNREPIYRWTSPDPIGMTKGEPERRVTLELRIESDADLSRIRDAVAKLQRPEPCAEQSTQLVASPKPA